MKTTLKTTRALLLLPVVALIATGCSGSSGSSSTDARSDAVDAPIGADGGQGGSGGGDGGAGADSGTAGSPFVYFVKQANGTTTATLAGGTFTVNSTYATSGNAFKYVAPNYYGTTSNGFIAFPTTMTGDFSISAQVNITTQNKANNASGVGLGITTGFSGTDLYGYVLMRNMNNSTSGYYVSGAGVFSAGAPVVPFDATTPLQLTFSRTGTNMTYSAGPVGGTATSQTTPTSSFTDGTTAYGGGAVYPAISFNNVAATITNLVIKDGTGATVYNSASGALVNYVPASLAVSAGTVSIAKGASTTVTATAVAIGGAVSGVTVVSSDPTVATATVANGATNSTITLNGLKGGVSTVTVTNTGDANSATNTKTILVAVAEYAATDPYGSIATLAYPAPAATNAYTDGELALTFDAPPTLNAGGLIKINKVSDGSEVDSIAFAGETQTFGATVINVGSQLVRLSGNTVFFTPHLGKLAYGTAYYVAIPTTSITGTLTGVAFNGFSNLSTVATWSFTTRVAPTLTANNVTVDGAQASTANFRTLQGALGALAAGLPGATSVTINVAAGTYNELVHYTGPGLTQTVNIIGPAGNTRGNNCIVQYANGNMLNGATQTRASTYFSGANIVLQNISLKNTGVRATVAQAEALFFSGGLGSTLAAFNSSFYSNQDTIQTSGRNWFFNCYVEGNVDFIWGTADAALFENCSLRFINDVAGGGAASYNLFVARTGMTIAPTASGTVGKGYVLLNSTVSVDANVTAFFGRDAGAGAFYDQAALINVTFSGAGTIGAGIWNVTTVPLFLGDPSFVGWKSAGCTGLNLATAVSAANTATTIASQATEYDTRDHILNRVVTITTGAPTGFQAVTTPWDVSALATAWSAP
jgi:Pectinesterase